MDNQIIKSESAAVVKYSNGEVVLPAHVIETLPNAVKSVIEAKTTPCIADYSQDELEERVVMLISGLYQDAGQTIDGKDLTVFAYRLCRELRGMIFLHFGELEIACNNGLKGLYGTNFGINLIGVLRWIEGYKSSEEHKRYAHEVARLIDRSGKIIVPTEEEKEEIGIQLACKTFEDFKLKKDINSQAVTVYDFLDSKGIIPFTKDQKIVFYNEAHIEVKKELALKASKTDNKTEASELKKQIKNVGSLQDGAVEDLSDIERTKLLLKNEAKRIALKAHFNNLIEFDLPLEF